MISTAFESYPPMSLPVINEMKAKARAEGHDVVDLGMGNPDGPTPRPVVNKLIEAARNPRNHRYSASRGIPQLRLEIAKTLSRQLRSHTRSGQRSDRHHRRQGRPSTPLIRRHRTGRRRSFSQSFVPYSSIRRNHGRGPNLHAADADPASFLTASRISIGRPQSRHD